MSEPTTPAALEPIPEQLERVLVVVAHPDDIEYLSLIHISEPTRPY